MKQDLSIHPLLEDDQYHWSQLLPILQSDSSQFSEDFQFKIQQLCIASSYAMEQLCREPTLLHQLHSIKSFQLDENEYRAFDSSDQGIEQVKRTLRKFRHRKLIEIIYLDVINHVSLQQTLANLSDLAEFLIRLALEASNNLLVAKHGQPVDENGKIIGLNIIAMGKLGGHELNFSSDIDLICCYANDGELDGYGRLTHQEFFSRVTRLLTLLLNESTEHGFVYRVDLRLRPWGDSGPVALSHAALEHYYQLHGREWEQYAMVKARILTGTELDKQYLASIFKPFVYRKYHDYRVFEGLSVLKDKINRQAKSRGMQDNIKLGGGGIREIEFFVQAFQILKGGRNNQLQNTQIFHCFDVLQSQKIVDSDTIEDLREAYIYLRQLENKIQMLADEQTHSCPVKAMSQNRIAAAMGHSDWQTVKHRLQIHRQKVNAYFTELFKHEVESNAEIVIGETTDDKASETAQVKYIESIGLRRPDKINDRLKLFFGSKAWGFMSTKARQRFSALIPEILKAVVQSNQQAPLFERLLSLFSSIAGRSVYFELLYQNTALLKKLVSLFDKSEWIAQEVANYPMLLEHLIQAGNPEQRFDQSILQQNPNAAK